MLIAKRYGKVNFCSISVGDNENCTIVGSTKIDSISEFPVDFVFGYSDSVNSAAGGGPSKTGNRYPRGPGFSIAAKCTLQLMCSCVIIIHRHVIFYL